MTDPLHGLGEFQYVLLEIKSGPSFAAKSVARVKKKRIRAKKKKKCWRAGGSSRSGALTFIFSSLIFSTCATDFAEKEELLEVVMLLSPVPPNKIQ